MKKIGKSLILLLFILAAAAAALVTGREKENDKSVLTYEESGVPLYQRMCRIAAGYRIEEDMEETVLPSSYDCRKEGRSVPVRDQGQYGTCWAFASLTALETSLMPEEQLDFSRDHLNYHNPYQMSTEDGGSYIMSVAYLTSWQGPVLEKEDPYGDQTSPGNLEAVRHVQEVRMPAAGDFEAIKRNVYLYGGVESSLYMDFTDPSEDSAYYSRKNASYCYKGENTPNHDIVIIGWDDSYPAKKFRKTPEGDGAFICQNSWGKSFGDEGIFYVSYYDANIGNYNVAYTRTEASDNYDVIYQSDLCGWCGQVGYNSDKACFANVYEAEDTQELQAAGFYATGGGTRYRLAVLKNFEEPSMLKDVIYTQSGYLRDPGYYTVELEKAVPVEKGERFAVVVQITTPESRYPIAVEFLSEALGGAVVLDDGEGYISADGNQIWERVETTQNSNLCLKVYAGKKNRR